MNRRSILKGLGSIAGLALSGSGLQLNALAQASASPAGAPSIGPYTLPPLPYAHDALEPYIDAETMHLHHDKHHAGCDANHSFWWPTLSRSGGDAPKAELAKDIDAQFGSFSQFQQRFSKTAGGVFGSGWTWLTVDGDGKVQIETSANQDSPISNGRTPILGLDVWEHAYYLKYQNRRPEYVAAFFHIVNWDYVSGEYARARTALRG